MRTLTVSVVFICSALISAKATAQQAPPASRPCLPNATPRPADAAPSPKPATATLAQLAWLPGNWVGQGGPVTVEERWTPSGGGATLGVSRTVRDGRMVAFEFLCIAERQGTLVYSAMPNGRAPATDFTLTNIDATSATFENPAHDFPKMIKYALKPDGTLDATISGAGGQRAQTFSFKKQ